MDRICFGHRPYRFQTQPDKVEYKEDTNSSDFQSEENPELLRTEWISTQQK